MQLKNIHYLEKRSIENTQTKKEMEKRKGRKIQKRHVQHSERKNIYVIEVPGEDKIESSTDTVSEEIAAKNFPKLKKN